MKSLRWNLSSATYSSLLVLLVVVLVSFPGLQEKNNFTAAEIYASRNECVSYETLYELKYDKDRFEVIQTIRFYTISAVKNCYFSAEDFILHKVELWEGERRLRISVDEIGNTVIAVKLLYGDWLTPNRNFTIFFVAVKMIEGTDEGLIFKVYRDLNTMKMNWYSIVKIGPAHCGKVYVCINTLRSIQTLKIVIVHPRTHKLLCSGVPSPSQSVPDDPSLLRSECTNPYPVGVNNIHFAVADVNPLVYDGFKENRSPHKISIVAPWDENGLNYHDVIIHFDMIQRIYSMLLLSLHLKPFHVTIYALPNTDIEHPQFRSGVCIFNFDNMHFQLELETLYRAYIRCLLHQGFLNDRQADSWPLVFVSEGLFEKFVSSFEVFSRTNEYFRDIIEGFSEDDLAPLAMHYDDPLQNRVNRPWRKSAGFFTMLSSVSPAYARATFPAFLENNRTLESLDNFWPWISKHSHLLQMNETRFRDLLYTSTALRGYPVLVSEVFHNRTVCVTQYGVGTYFESYILPVQLEYNLPHSLTTEPFWTDPEGAQNCRTVEKNLYPYLVNSHMNVVGRVQYDEVNWRVWADQLMKADVRKGMSPLRKVQLVTDALYFASQRKLRYSVALRFLFVMRSERDELAWRNFDKSLEFLEAKIRYSNVYTLFKKTMSDLTLNYFNASGQSGRPSVVAHKWSCMMGNPQCLNQTERVVEDTLRDHRFNHLPQILCAGMRRVSMETFRKLMVDMGMPDWREPDFYVRMLLCAENRKILRDLMHNLFFHNLWRFKRSQLKEMLLEMIKASKTGSDAAFSYLGHDPEGMVKRLGFDGVLEVIQLLATYQKENQWFHRFVRRMRVRGIVSADGFAQYEEILLQLRNNKMWHNTQFWEITRFIWDFGKHLRRYEEDKEEGPPEGLN